MPKFVEFCDVDGNQTSIAANAVVGVQRSTYTAKWTEPDARSPAERAGPIISDDNPILGLAGLLAGAVFLLRGLFTDSDDEDTDAKKEKQGRVVGYGVEGKHHVQYVEETRPCTLIHMQTGRRSRTIRVMEDYETVVRSLDSSGQRH